MSIENSSRARPLSDQERKALEEFAELKISFDELRECVRDAITFDFLRGERRLQSRFSLTNLHIRIGKWHIYNALEKKRRGEVSSTELSNWASVLQLTEAYDWEGDDEDEIADWLWMLASDIPASEND